MTTARRISLYLDANGIRKSFVAEKSGIKAHRLYYILSDHDSALSADEYFAICEAIGVGADFFMEEGQWKDSVLGTAG